MLMAMARPSEEGSRLPPEMFTSRERGEEGEAN